jgi:arsenite methyltransferase
MAEEDDRWSRWLLDRRDAGLESQRERTRGHLAGIRDRVLEGAGRLEGATVLDVGAGDGLIGLAALERVGPGGRVIFCDVSALLLERCRDAARSRGLIDRARFVNARAEDLAGIADASIDVITTRSVLIYVAEKSCAFAAFARVLRPQGGRISLFEPINRLMFPEPADRFHGYEIAAVADLAAKVKAQFPADTDDRAAMMGFDDRDLLDLTVAAGFARVRVECHLSVEPGGLMMPVSLDALLDGAPNPNAATVREAVVAALNDSEQRRFLTELRRTFDEDRAVRRMAGAYVFAQTD